MQNKQLLNTFFLKKNVLVAGGIGFIGINLIKELLDLGAKVTATYHKKKPFIFTNEVNYIPADLTHKNDCLKACSNQEYVFMCAAKSSGAGVMDKTPLVHLTPNIIMNSLILESSYECRVKKLMFISSNTVYPNKDYPMKETDVDYTLYDKYFTVGWMKLFSEKMCEMYSKVLKNKLPTLILRPSNLYGPFDKYIWSQSKVIAASIRKVLENNDPIEVWGDGNDIKDFLYIEDFIEFSLRLFIYKNDFDIVNVASGIQITVKDIVEHLLKIENKKQTKITYNLSKPQMIPKRLISIEKLNKLLIPNKPKFNIQTGLKKTVSWYKRFYSNQNPEEKNDYI